MTEGGLGATHFAWTPDPCAKELVLQMLVWEAGNLAEEAKLAVSEFVQDIGDAELRPNVLIADVVGFDIMHVDAYDPSYPLVVARANFLFELSGESPGFASIEQGVHGNREKD